MRVPKKGGKRMPKGGKKRMAKRGEKGFTLIELLIVVAILGVLAAIVIPNVGRFMGAGQTEAAKTELADVQLAVTAMMADNKLAVLPAGTFVTQANATSNMSAFPSNAVCAVDKILDPNGGTYGAGDKDGYILFGHDIDADGTQNNLVRYLANELTKGTYYVDADGTVYQATTGY